MSTLYKVRALVIRAVDEVSELDLEVRGVHPDAGMLRDDWTTAQKASFAARLLIDAFRRHPWLERYDAGSHDEMPWASEVVRSVELLQRRERTQEELLADGLREDELVEGDVYWTAHLRVRLTEAFPPEWSSNAFADE